MTMEGLDIGSFDACAKVVQLVWAKDAVYEINVCSFHGVHQPSLMDAFLDAVTEKKTTSGGEETI